MLVDIRQAQGAMVDVVLHTSLDKSTTFSSMAGYDVYLKLENLQKNGYLKLFCNNC